MKKRKNASVEYICWKSDRAETICTIGMALKENATTLTLYATHGNSGWTDECVVQKNSIIERYELDVVDETQ